MQPHSGHYWRSNTGTFLWVCPPCCWREEALTWYWVSPTLGKAFVWVEEKELGIQIRQDDLAAAGQPGSAGASAGCSAGSSASRHPNVSRGCRGQHVERHAQHAAGARAHTTGMAQAIAHAGPWQTCACFLPTVMTSTFAGHAKLNATSGSESAWWCTGGASSSAAGGGVARSEAGCGCPGSCPGSCHARAGTRMGAAQCRYAALNTTSPPRESSGISLLAGFAQCLSLRRHTVQSSACQDSMATVGQSILYVHPSLYDTHAG